MIAHLPAAIWPERSQGPRAQFGQLLDLLRALLHTSVMTSDNGVAISVVGKMD